jgi:hypothetical protein
MKRAAEQALAHLVGKPLWAIGKAASLAWFQFGERRPVVARGKRKQVGDYALHVDCPWSWQSLAGPLIADHTFTDYQLKRVLAQPVDCCAARAEDNGSFELRFADSSVLKVTVEDDPDAEAAEYWRLFRPYVDLPHFVISGKGIDE